MNHELSIVELEQQLRRLLKEAEQIEKTIKTVKSPSEFEDLNLLLISKGEEIRALVLENNYVQRVLNRKFEVKSNAK